MADLFAQAEAVNLAEVQPLAARMRPQLLAMVIVGMGAAILPGAAVARWILTPIDRAARFRKAPVRFSIGDFLCLFVAIQIPLAAIYQFKSDDEERTYWIFTIVTWLVAPVIWIACSHALSKAGVTKTWHRFVFLGLVAPLVYYGLIPFTVIGISFLVFLFRPDQIPITLLTTIWWTLGILFFASGVFVRWMVARAERDQPPISDLAHQNELARAAMYDDSATRLHGPVGETKLAGS